MKCLNCDSANVTFIEGDFPTGVIAPDGYQESWYQKGFWCSDCGAIEDEVNNEEEEEDNEQTNTPSTTDCADHANPA